MPPYVAIGIRILEWVNQLHVCFQFLLAALTLPFFWILSVLEQTVFEDKKYLLTWAVAAGLATVLTRGSTMSRKSEELMD